MKGNQEITEKDVSFWFWFNEDNVPTIKLFVMINLLLN